jgi:hypothetical protein
LFLNKLVKFVEKDDSTTSEGKLITTWHVTHMDSYGIYDIDMTYIAFIYIYTYIYTYALLCSCSRLKVDSLLICSSSHPMIPTDLQLSCEVLLSSFWALFKQVCYCVWRFSQRRLLPFSPQTSKSSGNHRNIPDIVLDKLGPFEAFVILMVQRLGLRPLYIKVYKDMLYIVLPCFTIIVQVSKYGML